MAGVDWRIPASVQSGIGNGAVNAFAAGQQNNRQNQALAMQQESHKLNQEMSGYKLDEERLRVDTLSTVENGQIISQAMKMGNPEAAISQLQQKKQSLQSQGRDFSQTDRQIQLLSSGQVDQAMSHSMQAYQNAQQRGWLNTPKAQADTRTSLQKNVEALYAKGTPEYNQAMIDGMRKSSGVTVNTGDNGEKLSFEEMSRREAEKAGLKATAESRAKNTQGRYNKMLEAVSTEGASARDVMSTIKLQRSLGANTGAGEGAIDMARRAVVGTARLFGADDSFKEQVASINDIAAFRSIQEKMVSDKLRAEPGVKTDGDATRMRNTLAQIDNPVEANDFIQKAMLAEATRKDNREKYYDNSQRETDDIDSIKSNWNEFVRKTPLSAKQPDGKIMFLYEFIEANQSLIDGGEMTAEEVYEQWRAHAN